MQWSGRHAYDSFTRETQKSTVRQEKGAADHDRHCQSVETLLERKTGVPIDPVTPFDAESNSCDRTELGEVKIIKSQASRESILDVPNIASIQIQRHPKFALNEIP